VSSPGLIGTHLAVTPLLGARPDSWEIVRFKAVFDRIDRRNDDLSYEMLSLRSTGELVARSEMGGRQEPDEASLPRYLIAEVDDLVVNPMWLIGGGIGVSDRAGAVSPDYRVFKPRENLLPRFIHYLMRSQPYLDQYLLYTRAQTTFDRRVQQPDLNNLPVPVPPLDEQRAIADYLDRETARIDTLIEEQQRLVEMLRERRRVLVARAVCFGLDEKVELRDSGDPVVGLVPAHWTVRSVRHWLESLDGRRIPLSAEERGDRRGDYDYYGASGVIDHVDDYLFDESLVLVSEDGANLLMRSTPIAFAAKGKYWVNNHAHVLRPLAGGDVDYWAQRLEAVDVRTVVSGSAQPKLTAGALNALRISAPEDVAEQRRIAAYVTEQTSRIDDLIRETEHFVDLSTERRAALITAAVTGQIDVRNEVA